MIHKIAWGLSLIFGGIMIAGFGLPDVALLTGVSLIVAGIAYLAGV